MNWPNGSIAVTAAAAAEDKTVEDAWKRMDADKKKKRHEKKEDVLLHKC